MESLDSMDPVPSIRQTPVIDDPLSLFLPPVAAWFRQALGEPTPVQRLGWPTIAAGKSSLLLAPTGSGKTLAAFLACLDHLWRQPALDPGVRILYVSPLKALNNDIHRNLQFPLQGVRDSALTMGMPLADLEAVVRTGDTPASERQRLIRKPAPILITTPESLHLLLTSKARDVLRGLSHCIVDEIHALCPNKRGVFLSVLLERLEAINPRSFVRIGLSATQRPLDEVARYLGGLRRVDGRYEPRPVEIVDAGLRKHIDLEVLSPVEQFGPLPEKSIWPSIYRLLADQIREHRSTIIFANNRRTVERLTTLLNEELADGVLSSSDTGATASFASEVGGRGGPSVRAHHGSVSLEIRQQIERSLKDGELKAVVATASLELGIDMGPVELVCQVESPGNVARGLQRVGRAGHLVGQQCKGRLIPKTLPDLVSQAVLAREMLAGNVEPMRVPRNCLDILAQQIVAMVAMDPWAIHELFAVVRQAYAYCDLSPQAYDAVLEMISGRFRFNIDTVDDGAKGRANPATQLSALQPRVSWDRVNQTLRALPGSQSLALLNGGTIPDMGQYAVVTPRGLRIGELDEEFVFERRVGDTFTLGTNTWRIDRIEVDRVVVLPAEGAPAMTPFWHGEQTGRSFALGAAQGGGLRELVERIDAPDCLDWLQGEFHLDRFAAHSMRDYVRRQLAKVQAVPNDRLILIEASRDPLGDWQLMILSPLGARFHLTLRLALENLLRQRLGYRPQCMHHDDGLLLRLTDSDEPVLDLLSGLTPANLERLVLDELGDSALFALRFRHNAARALLMPRGGSGRRAPLWLQRLRGRDLLQVARRHPDFPIVVETIRECVHDYLAVDRVQQVLSEIQSGEIEVRSVRLDAPSPFGANLLLAYQMAFMYTYDSTEPTPTGTSSRLDQHLLDQLLGHANESITPDAAAVVAIERRLRGVGQPPRTPQEMAEWLRRVGDASDSELEGPMAGFLQQLAAEGQVDRIEVAGVAAPGRWVLHEEADDYRTLFGARERGAITGTLEPIATRILRRFLDTHSLVGLDDVLARYPFEPGWAKKQLQSWTRGGQLVVLPARDDAPVQWATAGNFQQLQRSTLALRRREVITCPPQVFANFVLHWQHLDGRGGPPQLATVLEQLRGLALPTDLWERAILPARLGDYQPRWLDELVGEGGWLWSGRGGRTGVDELALLPRDRLMEIAFPALVEDEASPGAAEVVAALETRGALFVADLAQRTQMPPSVVRASLWALVRRGLVTNDRFDVVRRGEVPDGALAVARPSARRGAWTRASSPRIGLRPEGRWSLIPYTRPDAETAAVAAARRLLDRYGVVSRELAMLDSAMPPWRILYEVLSHMELTDEVRRGYFVEGLSGAQFALPDAARLLHDIAGPVTPDGSLCLLNTFDPANLHGGVFELPLEAGRLLTRRTGTWIILRGGSPVLLAEQAGKRIVTVERSEDVLARAVKLLPRMLGSVTDGRGGDLRARITVEEWNGRPVTTSEGKDLLESAGFVRDYQSMTWFAAW